MNSITIVTVDNIDQALSILKVMPPKGADLVLSANIPDGKLYIVVVNSSIVVEISSQNMGER